MQSTNNYVHLRGASWPIRTAGRRIKEETWLSKRKEESTKWRRGALEGDKASGQEREIGARPCGSRRDKPKSSKAGSAGKDTRPVED